VLVVSLLGVGVSAAAATTAWRIDALGNSTAAPGGTLDYVIELRNVGDDFLFGGFEPISLTGTLPAGLTIVRGPDGWDCSTLVVGAQSFTCQDTSDFFTTMAGSGVLAFRKLTVQVAVDPGASGVLTSGFAVAGGDQDGDPSTPAASTVAPVTITTAPPSFGIAAFDAQVTADVAGTPYTQAAGHPFEASTSIDFNTFRDPDPLKEDLTPVEAVRDIDVDLPPGFFGDPHGLGQCTPAQLANGALAQSQPQCPATSQVGTTIVRANASHMAIGPVPVYNMVPPPDAPARLGFNVLGTVVTLDVKVRSESDYGLTAHLRNISEGLGIAGSTMTLWGVPADPSHNSERACPGQSAPYENGATCTTGTTPTAFLRNPTSCPDPGVGLPTTLSMDSWVHSGAFVRRTIFSHLPSGYPFAPADWGSQQGTTDCNKVPFDPTFKVTPDSPQASQPTGFAFDVSFPQTDDPSVIGQSDLRKAVVTLPAGVRVNPSSADGLSACSESQIGLLGTSFPEPYPVHFSEGEPACPAGSRIGSVTVKAPALENPLEGSVYLASQGSNPFGSLLALYLYIHGSGVVVKLAGHVEPDPVTGRLVAVFDNNPQVPFSNLHLQLKDGPRAPLVNPSRCGTYTTTGDFTGWSGKTVENHSSFTITQGPDGGPCPTTQFKPSLTAGTTNPSAGAYTPFTLQLQRSDSDEELRSLASLSLPPGLLANVASITTRCTDEQADAHSCPADSHIGEVTAGAGAGPNPFYVGGDVYLTGPYEGDPFAIAVVVHAQAGPFDLGYVVVKGAIQIHDDGSVTVATDPFPTILQGIPLQIRDVRVNLDRPGFMFNPTNCNPMSINGTVQSTANQQAGVSSRFQVGECANLAFKPSFTVSTAGKTSKANGASLHVHLATHQGPTNNGAAGESNIAKVDVQLPVVLPARLPTLQKACTAAQFAANPAGCPVGSFVGTAIAHTPILASPLSGPAILVSHGGEAFPDLVLVLQGEGVRINLTGHTQIKKGITFNHFETVPDAPVSSFDLTLPAGPHGVLTTDIPGRNLCATTRTVTVTKRVTRRVHGHNRRVTVKAKKAVAAPLLMPTTMTAQNGAIIHQNTKIAVTGCAKGKMKAKGRPATKGRRH
jgi:hypothetical protein